MLGSQTRHRGTRRNRPRPNPKDLQVCWVNVGRSGPSHITILQTAFTEQMDVVCVQEPYSASGTKTQSHPGFDLYAPADSWDWEKDDTEQREAQRPRVLTYVRRGPGLKVQQRRPIESRLLLWGLMSTGTPFSTATDLPTHTKSST